MKRLTAAAAAILIAARAGAGTTEDWQSSAKGLGCGPLCSLAVQVRIGASCDLWIPAGSINGGWGTVIPWDIPLGTVSPGAAGEIAGVKRSGDWSGGRADLEFGGGAKLTLYASRLSPGIVVETAGDRLCLFGGRHDRTVTFDEKGSLKVRGQIAGKPLPRTAITPALAAVYRGKGVNTRRLAAGEAAIDGGGFLLAWWGRASHFLRTTLPLDGAALAEHVYQADYPLLLVFDQPPKSIAVARAGGIEFAFAKAGHRLAVVPLFAARFLRAEATEAWAGGLPTSVVGRCRRLASLARKYPISARRGFRYDTAGDVATFTERVTFLAVGAGGRALAPLPPTAALARQTGLKIDVPGELFDPGVVTPYGPIVGAADTNAVTWSVRGLGRYVAEGVAGASPGGGTAGATLTAPAGPAPGEDEQAAAVAAELAAQVDRITGAGALLAPWSYADNVPISDSRGEYYFGEPGEVLHLLCEVHPLLGGSRRAALARYMTALYRAYPPCRTALIPADKGARRGGYDGGPNRLAKRVADERGKRVSVYALYGAARYLSVVGKKPDTASWAGYRKVLTDAFGEQAWGTMYLLGHPNRLLPWQRKKLKDTELSRFLTSAHWRGDRPAAVVNVNRQFAGAVGAVRLARLAADKQAEQLAWRLLARSAVARYAFGKYAAWRYAAGLAPMPPDGQWFWKWRRRFPQSWGGDLETNDWSKPSHDVRQVVEFAPDRVALAHWAGVVGNAWTQRCTAQLVAFRCLTPELARFLRDHLRAECRALVRRIEWNHPVWYASFAEAILGWEHNMNHPSDAHQVFLAHAEILRTDPRRLVRWLDVPWLRRGDLFYLSKLAATLRACRRTGREGR